MHRIPPSSTLEVLGHLCVTAPGCGGETIVLNLKAKD